MERLRLALEDRLDQYLVPATSPDLRFQDLGLDESEQVLRDTIDGTRTLRQVLAMAPLPDKRALAVVYTLIATGAVAVSDQPVTIFRADDPVPAAGLPTVKSDGLSGMLAAELADLERRDPFQLLALDPERSDQEFEQAYSVLAQRFHADRFAHLGPETRRLAHEIFLVIRRAYDAVSTTKKRRHLAAAADPRPPLCSRASAGNGDDSR
jgi:hypothetical protein